MKNIAMKKKSLGQGMTEYIIIVALIAIAAIGVFKFFGETARNQMGGMAMELGGKDGADAITEAGNAADAAAEEGAEKDLGSYNGGNTKTAK